RGEREQRLSERALDHPELVAARLLLLRSALLLDELDQPTLQGLQTLPQRRISGVANEAGPGPPGQADEWRIDVPLPTAQGPGRTREVIKRRQVLGDAGALPEQGNAIGFSLLIEIQLRIEVAEPSARRRQLMQELALVLARLYQILLAREPIDDSDLDPGL